eukprot:5319781-Pyramimonas_sp.AAC.1
MALRRPGGDDLNPDQGPINAIVGATAKAAPKPKPETIELPSSSDSDSCSISPSLGPEHPKPKKKKRKSPDDDPNPGDIKRYAGQPAEQHADRQRSRGPAVAVAAADTRAP